MDESSRQALANIATAIEKLKTVRDLENESLQADDQELRDNWPKRSPQPLRGELTTKICAPIAKTKRERNRATALTSAQNRIEVKDGRIALLAAEAQREGHDAKWWYERWQEANASDRARAADLTKFRDRLLAKDRRIEDLIAAQEDAQLVEGFDARHWHRVVHGKRTAPTAAQEGGRAPQGIHQRAAPQDRRRPRRVDPASGERRHLPEAAQGDTEAQPEPLPETQPRPLRRRAYY